MTELEYIEAIRNMGKALWRVSLSGRPIPFQEKIFKRMQSPISGDIVFEQSTSYGSFQEHQVGIYDRTEMEQRGDGEDSYSEKITIIRSLLDNREVRWENCNMLACLPKEGWEND